jgi:hypothetical protein
MARVILSPHPGLWGTGGAFTRTFRSGLKFFRSSGPKTDRANAGTHSTSDPSEKWLSPTGSIRARMNNLNSCLL